MKQVLEGSNGRIRGWVGSFDKVDPKAVEQLRNVASLPFVHSHVAVMPDVHLGIGATVGSVIPTHKAIIPAAVGVDIGCGMMACRTQLKASDLPDNLAHLRDMIEKRIPVGMGDGGEHRRTDRVHYLADKLPNYSHVLKGDLEMVGKAARQLGTLGSGNHFIEVCLDENQSVWVMLHSGSRGVGNILGRRYIELAKREMERWFITLPDQDLAYLAEGTEHYGGYISAVKWAQEYALTNRQVMMEEALMAMSHFIGRPVNICDVAVNCHHNYVTMENHGGKNVWVTRKGAIRAQLGDYGIIPGSMGAKSFIVRGKGNAESFHSCSHGAGRVMSRNQARAAFTIEDLEKQTAGVECRKDANVVDEIPGAYKDIDEVMANQSDLVEIVHTLKQIICVKGG